MVLRPPKPGPMEVKSLWSQQISWSDPDYVTPITRRSSHDRDDDGVAGPRDDFVDARHASARHSGGATSWHRAARRNRDDLRPGVGQRLTDAAVRAGDERLTDFCEPKLQK